MNWKKAGDRLTLASVMLFVGGGGGGVFAGLRVERNVLGITGTVSEFNWPLAISVWAPFAASGVVLIAIAAAIDGATQSDKLRT